MASNSADKPLSTEPDASSDFTKSFADRLTFPGSSETAKAPPTSLSADTSSKFNWADEVETPIQEKSNNLENGNSKTDGAADGESSLSMAQTDGSTTWMNGSQGLDEPEFDVSVKLADLQDDPNNPLYSVKDFQDLNLYVQTQRHSLDRQY